MEKVLTIPKPLLRISPSQFTAIKKCPYKTVLAKSCSYPLLPYTPASHLGNILHACLQLILTGQIMTISDFDKKWDYFLEKEEKSIQKMGFGFYTPLSENVPGYTIKKLQLKSLLKDRKKKELSRDKKTGANILTEKWLEAKDLLIGGYADIIINSGNFTKLSDFKSGKILLEEGDIKEEYEDQLKLYAYLYNDVFGKYPNELSIIDLNRKEYQINFTPQECKTLANEARETLSQINDLVEKGKYRGLAKPEIEACRMCLYRPACDYYWEVEMPETDSVFSDVKGVVSAVKEFRNGNFNIIFHNENHQLIVSNLNREIFTLPSDLVGKEIAFYNVKQLGEPGKYSAIKTTKIYEK